AALADAQEHLYRYSFALAYRDWWAGNVTLAEERLAQCPPHLRHWEWHYLRRLCENDGTVYRGLSAEVVGVAYRPDGTQLAGIDRHGNICIWDVATGAPLRSFTRRPSISARLYYSPDGRFLAAMDRMELLGAAFRRGSVQAWEVDTGREVLALTEEGFTIAAAASANGQRLITAGSDGACNVRDLVTGEILNSVP